ncbi:hypothetical protein C8Q73DRAFT_511423 [Cubamyces lactineus]|nr:hypothetical protein C8Q73DRAFT_511423 [Cubamyces lactineus]
MDPVRASDRTCPSKSGRPPRQFPLRMPYATPFLLTKAVLAMASVLPTCGPSPPASTPDRPDPSLALPRTRSSPRPPGSSARYSFRPSECSHWPIAIRGPFRAFVLPDHLCPLCTAFTLSPPEWQSGLSPLLSFPPPRSCTPPPPLRAPSYKRPPPRFGLHSSPPPRLNIQDPSRRLHPSSASDPRRLSATEPPLSAPPALIPRSLFHPSPLPRPPSSQSAPVAGMRQALCCIKLYLLSTCLLSSRRHRSLFPVT